MPFFFDIFAQNLPCNIFLRVAKYFGYDFVTAFLFNHE